MDAASYKSAGIDFNAAKYIMRKNGDPTQIFTNIIENLAQKVSLSQGMPGRDIFTKNQLIAL